MLPALSMLPVLFLIAAPCAVPHRPGSQVELLSALLLSRVNNTRTRVDVVCCMSAVPRVPDSTVVSCLCRVLLVCRVLPVAPEPPWFRWTLMG